MNSSAKSLNPVDFGRKITLLRKQQGISQKDLALKSGVPLTAVRRCEQKGQIPLERYLAMTSALGAMVDVLESESPKVPTKKTVRKTSNHQIFRSRQEAKWQFRRKLLLTTANLLEKKSEQVWPKVTKTVSMLLSNPSTSIQKSTRRWLRFAGNSPQVTIQTIRAQFGQDTPEGPRRHKLQDLSDGHPFSGILSEATLRKLREDAYKNCGADISAKS